jgi:hypothetical protein
MNGTALATTMARCQSPEKVNAGATGLNNSASAPNVAATG